MSDTTEDAKATRWLNRYHAKEHVRLGAAMPGVCVVCYFARRLKEVKAENKRLRVILNGIAAKAEREA